MGTLLSQPIRRRLTVNQAEVESFLEEAHGLSKRFNISIEAVLDVYKILEMKRRNDLFADNGDIHDEQMQGIGECLQAITNSIDSLSSAATEKED